MQRALMTALGVIVVACIALPVIAYVTRDADTGDTAEAAIPSVSEAPPEWDEESLAGTAWTADMSNAEGEWKAELIFTYYFQRPGRVILRTTDAEMIDESDAEYSEADKILMDSLWDAFLSDEAGSYSIEDGTIEMKIMMLGMERSDTIEIRGNDLYYHGVKMTETEPFEPEV